MPLNIIEYIIKTKGLKQKDLADMLKVSRAQISKWKSGEHIPPRRKDELMVLADLFTENPEWAVFVKNKKDSDAWINYVTLLNEQYDGNTKSVDIESHPEEFVPKIILFLSNIGIAVPQKKPSTKKIKEGGSLTNFELLLLDYIKIYEVLTGWCATYMSSLHDAVADIEDDIYNYMINYALCFTNSDVLGVNGADLSSVQSHNEMTKINLYKKIEYMCSIMRDENISFRTDYFNLLNLSIAQLKGEEEAPLCQGHDDLELFLPYQDKLILRKIQRMELTINDLHNKIDFLTEKLEKSLSS
ncbi:MAG: helix-turn-helix transcriptional regulator [Desulfobacter sp.]|nr:MAG: helix-turn-helix transcriptional regulator [Desulfobacter sp.]